MRWGHRRSRHPFTAPSDLRLSSPSPAFLAPRLIHAQTVDKTALRFQERRGVAKRFGTHRSKIWSAGSSSRAVLRTQGSKKQEPRHPHKTEPLGKVPFWVMEFSRHLCRHHNTMGCFFLLRLCFDQKSFPNTLKFSAQPLSTAKIH